MQLALPSKPTQGRKLLAFQALLCLALFIAIQLFADSSTLHRWIHSDASDSQHTCAFTLLTKGQVSVADSGVLLVPFVAVLFFCLPLFVSTFSSSVECRLYPSRAPPRR